MKKFLVLLLAMVVLMSMSSFALAFERDSNFFEKWKSGAKIKGDIYKNIKFENEAEAESGNAEAYANQAATCVNSTAEAKAMDDQSTATNESARAVSNTGTADAWSAPADALNEANNNENEIITETAEAYSDCSAFVEGTIEVDGIGFVDANSDGKCDTCGHEKDLCECCDCCPAEVQGDIDIKVEFENEADAETGDAYAYGNSSMTEVVAYSKALASNGGMASNTDDVMVINDGVATGNSGTAVATNLANNDVCIDIFRGALSSKTIDVLVDFLVK